MQANAAALRWAGRDEGNAVAGAAEDVHTGFLVHVVPLSTIMKWYGSAFDVTMRPLSLTHNSGMLRCCLLRCCPYHPKRALSQA